jgi:LysR family transcriptional regulator, cys regulon transcriptional activator
MNLQKLRYLREIARHDLNLTRAAHALHTSQPGVSRQIIEMEEELGVDLFVRKGRRLTQLTEPGRRVLGIAERILVDLDNIKQVAADYEQEDSGELIIATTHTQARYKLPPVIRDFRALFPKVSIVLRQGTPLQIADQVRHGQADIGIATEALADAEGLISMPSYEWNHVAVTPAAHPLAKITHPKLEQLAQYPLLTYDNAFAGRNAINLAFAKAGLHPNVAISALDSDVIKTYVRLGLGVGLIASVAYDPNIDEGLIARDCGHLFGRRVTRIALATRNMPRNYVFALIERLAPGADMAALRKALG